MICRAAIGGLLASVALLGLGPQASGGPPPLSARPSQFVVRSDPRLCPSPLCGGYWIALANHARTRCHDGLLRPRCYVASAIDKDRRPLGLGIPDGALVWATLGSSTYGSFGLLGELRVRDVRAGFGEKPTGSFFRVRDLGVRCIRAPCFSFAAASLNRAFQSTVSDVDLGPALLMADERGRAEAAVASPGGLFVSGRIERMSPGGRVLRVSRVYLKATPPRA